MPKKEIEYNFDTFRSLSNEELSFKEMLEAIFKFIEKDRNSDYKIMVGTDSEGYGDVSYVSAVVIHRIGNGARAFICKNKVGTPTGALREKIYNETLISASLAQRLVPSLTDVLGGEFVQKNLIIHIDVGQKGDTKQMIKEVAGMIVGYGFQVETKPKSIAASNVADRFCAPPKHVSPLPAT
ncbi:MAG: ribonuclease H-like YkuK family protein [Candidatus Spechtbacterales bacterium]|nr:ribonuclease H-like YkuK family protein [Candidatus Spechtbacterales bacterium]